MPEASSYTASCGRVPSPPELAGWTRSNRTPVAPVAAMPPSFTSDTFDAGTKMVATELRGTDTLNSIRIGVAVPVDFSEERHELRMVPTPCETKDAVAASSGSKPQGGRSSNR